MDGITLGRPMCSYPTCKLSLESTKDRFCLLHSNRTLECSIVGCASPVTEGSLTCEVAEHKAAEKTHIGRRSAAFQLKGRMERARVAHPRNAEANEDIDVATLVEEEGGDEETYRIVNGEAVPTQPDLPTQAEAARLSALPAVPPSALPVPIPGDDNNSSSPPVPAVPTAGGAAPPPGPPPPPPPPSGGPARQPGAKIRAVFGRKRTHNEQILVAPCGVIIARDTFYNAESIPSIAVSPRMRIWSCGVLKLTLSFCRTLSSVPFWEDRSQGI